MNAIELPTMRVAHLLLSLLLGATGRSLVAQAPEAPQHHTTVTAAATVTNNGISIIPSFTLGRPAALFNLTVARHRASFEPDFRVGLDGKPWGFVFWGRYKLVDGQRMHVQVGAHPAVTFRTIAATAPGGASLIAVRRYAAGEISSMYAVSRHVSVGGYYLGSYGIESDAARHTHFVAARATLSQIPVAGQYSLRFAPQAYYLMVDATHGTYVNSTVTLARRNLPLSIGATINQAIRSTVVQKSARLWNVSLTYEFH